MKIPLASVCLMSFLYLGVAAKRLEEKPAANISIEEDVSQLSWEGWCKLQPNGYDCGRGKKVKYYFDLQFGFCKTAVMGNKCLYNLNRFDSLKECKQACQDYGTHALENEVGPGVFCRFQPDFGQCNSYFPRFYFDVTARTCKGFSYSGCGGNFNRFSSYQTCSVVCMPIIEYNVSQELFK